MHSCAGLTPFMGGRAAPMADGIIVEVVFALPDTQSLLQVSLPQGATVADAIETSDIAALFPDVNIDRLPTGVWGHPVDRGQELNDGDRVEIYRELKIDPREARRRLALTGRTMSQSGD